MKRKILQVARAVKDMVVTVAVLTSVTRDDLPDGGAGHFVDEGSGYPAQLAETKIECLIPDFRGSELALAFFG